MTGTTEPYLVLAEDGEAQVIEKKSRFIAIAKSVATHDAAISYLEECKTRYWDATHHVYAYVLGEKGENLRYTDDREPPQTAGKPILDVILGSKIRNVVVIVIRYFGGTLLGTGPLARAYAQAAKEALANAQIAHMVYGYTVTLIVPYPLLGKIQYEIRQRKLDPISIEYGESVTIVLNVPADASEAFKTSLDEATAGTIQWHQSAGGYFECRTRDFSES
ncbi:MAG: IMPACT family protein [Lachnospiraceae bacterium]|jgi:uncharacterized YigZ family protein|nr:IMPACT family protein [Lachnospiraceae bacterium]